MRSLAVDVVLGCSKSHALDSIQICERREADATACGRQIRTTFEPSDKETTDVPTGVAAGEFDSDIRLAPPEVHPSTPKASASAATTGDCHRQGSAVMKNVFVISIFLMLLLFF